MAEMCDFDGGPFQDADIEIEPGADGTLPLVLVAYLDKDDYWAAYVRTHPRFYRVPGQPTYSYCGPAAPSEIARCPRVPGAAERGHQSTPAAGEPS